MRSARGAVFWTVGIGTALLAGVVVASPDQSRLLIFLIGALALMGIAAAAAAAWTPFDLLAVAGIVTCASVNVPRALTFGPATLLGLATLGFLGLGTVFYLVDRPQRDIADALRGWRWFVAWAVASLIWHTATINGLQNVAMFGTFLVIAGATAMAARSNPGVRERVYRWFDAAVLVSAGVYVASVMAYGFGTDTIIAARALSLLEVLGVARGLSEIRYGSRRKGMLIVVAAIAAILLSLSRTALAISLLLIPFAWLDRRSLSRRAGVVVLVAIVGGVFAFAALTVTPLRDRFLEPDRQNVGGVSVSVSGRGEFWSATWRSWLQSPWIGNGAGSSEYLPKQYLPERANYSHPHNDYLRVLHDYGAIGALIWLGGVVSLYRSRKRLWRAAATTAPSDARVHATAVLALTGIGLVMLTDNAIVYLFVMLPLGMMLGLSLGIRGGARTDQRVGPLSERNLRRPVTPSVSGSRTA